MNENITIFLSPLDAEKFMQFQKNYAIFDILNGQGVFDVKFGKVTLNFANAELQTIVKEEVVYKR